MPLRTLDSLIGTEDSWTRAEGIRVMRSTNDELRSCVLSLDDKMLRLSIMVGRSELRWSLVPIGNLFLSYREAEFFAGYTLRLIILTFLKLIN